MFYLFIFLYNTIPIPFSVRRRNKRKSYEKCEM